MEKYEILEEMKGYMTSDELLMELVDALSSDEAIENFEFIIRMNDLPIDI